MLTQKRKGHPKVPACSRSDEQPNEHLQTPPAKSEESAMNDDAEKSAGAMLVAVEAVLTETRETVSEVRLP